MNQRPEDLHMVDLGSAMPCYAFACLCSHTLFRASKAQ